MDLPINRAVPQIMHIDLNSCFAMLEQQANPLLRHKPVAVAAYLIPTAIILAASYEAKAYGIKLGTHVGDAKQLCPELIVLMPDAPKYREAHQRFKKVLLNYTSLVQPRSIDEFVLDFTGSPALRAGRDLVDVGYEIKQAIKDSLGSYVTVNVGLAPNRFLAKVAAGLHKPDGLDVLTADNLIETYKQLKLTDLPGINVRYRARLLAAGISNPLDFYKADADYLRYVVFKSIVGHYWYQRLRGWEADAVQWGRKSIGHQYAIEDKTSDRQELSRLLMKLCEKTGRRLRRLGFTAGGVNLSLRFVGHTYWHKSVHQQHRLYATQDIYAAALELLKAVRFPDKVSLISVTVYGLEPLDPEQLGLFDNERLAKQVLARAADDINDRYGEFALVPAIMAEMDKTILDRVAFGNTLD
jgi:DNA polymerase-4